MTGTNGIDDIIEQQGWNEETLLCLVLGFLNKNDLLGELEEYLTECQEEENAPFVALGI